MEVLELISALEGNLNRYETILNKIDLKSLSNNNADLYWKIQERLVMLSSVQDEVVDFRLKKILSEEHPYLPQIEVSRLQHDNHRHNGSLAALADDFLKRRRELMTVLSSLPGEKWTRTGVHEVEGHITFGELVRRMTEKDLTIISQLDKLVASAKPFNRIDAS